MRGFIAVFLMREFQGVGTGVGNPPEQWGFGIFLGLCLSRAHSRCGLAQSYLGEWCCSTEGLTPTGAAPAHPGDSGYPGRPPRSTECLQSSCFPLSPHSCGFPVSLHCWRAGMLHSALQLQNFGQQQRLAGIFCSGAAVVPKLHPRASRRRLSPPQTSLIFWVFSPLFLLF